MLEHLSILLGPQWTPFLTACTEDPNPLGDQPDVGPVIKFGTNINGLSGDFVCLETMLWSQFVASIEKIPSLLPFSKH
jgi:hypothetical protein